MKFYISLSCIRYDKKHVIFLCELKFKVPIYIYIYIERERERNNHRIIDVGYRNLIR